MTDTSIKQGKPWIRILLVISLGMNLAVVGLVIGAKISGHGPRGMSHANGSGMRVLMHALPNSKRADVRKYFHENRDRIRAKDSAMRASLDNITTAITAQPFDANALNEGFSAQRAHIVAITQNAQQAFVAIIASMTDKERAEYVDNMKEQRHKWRRDHFRKPKD